MIDPYRQPAPPIPVAPESAPEEEVDYDALFEKARRRSEQVRYAMLVIGWTVGIIVAVVAFAAICIDERAKTNACEYKGGTYLRGVCVKEIK